MLIIFSLLPPLFHWFVVHTQEIPIVFAGNKCDLAKEERKVPKELVSNYVHYELPRLRAKVSSSVGGAMTGGRTDGKEYSERERDIYIYSEVVCGSIDLLLLLLLSLSVVIIVIVVAVISLLLALVRANSLARSN